MSSLLGRSRELHLSVPQVPTTDYVNTIASSNEPHFPGNEALEREYRSYIRWNAAMLVHRAQRPGIEVGGHISSYASAASLYEVGFNHFFRGSDHPGGGDQVFFQGHASPGMYAHTLLETDLLRPTNSTGSDKRCLMTLAVFQLPAPASTPRFLAISNGVHGHRTDQRNLSSSVQQIHDEPWD